MNEKNIPFKNYLFLGIILILSIIILIYFYMWYGEYENAKNTSIMDKYLSVINYNELEDYLIENKSAIIYVSGNVTDEVKLFEKKFRNIVNNYSLSNSILYLDMSNVNEKEITIIKNNYNLKELPCIMIFKKGIVYDIYGLRENEYDVDNLVDYLENEGVIND